MSLITSSTIFYINSNNRISGTHSDFLYQISMPPESKYDQAVVLQANIPKSYYIVQANESFILNENGNQVNIVIPVGNYTRKSFASTVQGLLIANSPNGYTYAITYPTSSTIPDTGKYTFTVSNNLGIQPSFIFSASNDLGSHMGFSDESTNIFAGNTLTSTNVINLQAETALYIHSDICTNSNDNILQEIFATSTSDYGSIVFQQQSVDGYSKKITSNSNNVYHFYLSDRNSRAIDLNGQNITFTLLLYKKNNIYELAKQFIKFQAVEHKKIS